MKTISCIFLLLAIIALLGCASEPEESFNGLVTASLEFKDLDQADMVGCAASAFSPDGKKDLHFRLELEPPSIGDIAQIDIERRGSALGSWTTGSANYALGVSGIESGKLRGTNGSVIHAKEYQKGVDLFACDDGASGAADLFVASISLIGGQNYRTPPTTLSSAR